MLKSKVLAHHQVQRRFTETILLLFTETHSGYLLDLPSLGNLCMHTQSMLFFCVGVCVKITKLS